MDKQGFYVCTEEDSLSPFFVKGYIYLNLSLHDDVLWCVSGDIYKYTYGNFYECYQTELEYIGEICVSVGEVCIT